MVSARIDTPMNTSGLSVNEAGRVGLHRFTRSKHRVVAHAVLNRR